MTSTGKARMPIKNGSAAGKKAAAIAKPIRDDFIEFLIDTLAELGPVDAKRFFGGTGLLLDGTQFAFVISGTLWMRVDEAGKAAFLAAGSMPFTYRTSRREVALTGYYAVPASMLEDADQLGDWSKRAYQIALADREMKPKRPKAGTAKPASRPRR
jgi:TfoX/Sxy family transcriptional regulator of competence genes